MQTFKFVTKEKDKFVCWCTTNELKTFRDFMQYVLDNCDRPEDYLLYDVKNNKVYNMKQIATEVYFMRKRTFTERMMNFQTGKWSGKEI